MPAEKGKNMQTEILVRKAQKGDKDAFLELMLMQKEYLYKMAFLYTGNREMALDAVQECTIAGMKSIGKLKRVECFKSWLTRILINCALGEMRKNKRYVQETEEDAWKDTAQEESGGVSAEEKLDLYQAIERLGHPYKEIIIQKYFFDYKLEEIADILGMPLGTVKVYHARAKKKMKNYLI